MNIRRTILATVFASVVMAAPAYARDPRPANEYRLPDGTIVAVVDDSHGGVLAPSRSTLVVYECPLISGQRSCHSMGAPVIAHGPSAVQQILDPLAHMAGEIGGAAALRPTRYSEANAVTVNGGNATGGAGGSSSATGGSSSAQGGMALSEAQGGSSSSSATSRNRSDTSSSSYTDATLATDGARVNSGNTYDSDNIDSLNSTNYTANYTPTPPVVSGKGIIGPSPQ